VYARFSYALCGIQQLLATFIINHHEEHKAFFYLRVLRGKKYHSNSDPIAQKKPRRINRRGFSVKWLPACALRADSKSLTV
jgi:hypothetical protein